MTLSDFLRALFLNLASAFIEVRLIEDKKSGAVVERRWYASPDELLSDLDRLNQVAVTKNAAVFYGVLPRRERGKGKAEDVIAGRVVWADIDFKDFGGGESEARKRLSEFPIQPSIVVASGHGLHVFWLLREPAEPKEITAIARALCGILGADHCFDSARVLRLPGTFNRKDPENPIAVAIEKLDANWQVNPIDLEEAIGSFGSESDSRVCPDAGSEPIVIGEGLSEAVQALLASDKKLNGLFMGQGKPPTKRDGRPADCSSSGYDSSLVCALIKHGVTDPSELVTTLHWRPDGGARKKGTAYIERTVREALEFMTAQEKRRTAANFMVQKFRIFDHHPTTYEITVDGVTFKVGTKELISPNLFRTRFADAVRRVPILPPKDDWAKIVNVLLAQAERVDLPPEASRDPALDEAIEEVIAGLQEGEEPADLDLDKAVVATTGSLAGQRVFTAKTLLRLMKEDYPKLDRGTLCVHLRLLGCTDGQLTDGDRRRRVWLKSPK